MPNDPRADVVRHLPEYLAGSKLHFLLRFHNEASAFLSGVDYVLLPLRFYPSDVNNIYRGYVVAEYSMCLGGFEEAGIECLKNVPGSMRNVIGAFRECATYCRRLEKSFDARIRDAWRQHDLLLRREKFEQLLDFYPEQASHCYDGGTTSVPKRAEGKVVSFLRYKMAERLKLVMEGPSQVEVSSLICKDEQMREVYERQARAGAFWAEAGVRFAEDLDDILFRPPRSAQVLPFRKHGL